ncbi:hypothetical protein IOQ59_17380 [Pontibacterium sp. N1Y112]|uniref:Uncharacterized protein n=1 Tax=Pontibacterium sinense TaxID=2781979 RepID=A0A8J7FG83_9GAMM|nr:hypothetical protein [Pontibacterium sinense]MBE9399034.1 hypothetical protein [Pontibacterium sinense]
MKLAASNLTRATQLADRLLSLEAKQLKPRSASWQGVSGDQPQRVAIWANRPEHKAGSIDGTLGDELLAFLADAEAAKVDRIILCLDSAGVSLTDDWQGMQRCAAVIKALHRLNIRSQIVTVAVLGEEVGCFGGALLIAGACQYQLGSVNGQYGVSGTRVITQLTGETLHQEPFYYSAIYRLLNTELSALLPDNPVQVMNLLLALPVNPMTLLGLRQRLDGLLQKSAEDHAALINSGHFSAGVPQADAEQTDALGFSGTQALGCDELLAFCDQLLSRLEASESLPVLSGDAVQQFSLSNEQQGFSTYLSLTSAILRYAAERQPPLTVKVEQVGSGATFIALSLMADELVLEKHARIYSLPPAVIEQFTGRPELETRQGVDWKTEMRV